MGTLVGIKEGFGPVGLMLALLPWHWLIKDILAKAPSFLSEKVTFDANEISFSASRSFTGRANSIRRGDELAVVPVYDE